jgi:hypothetical protein
MPTAPLLRQRHLDTKMFYNLQSIGHRLHYVQQIQVTVLHVDQRLHYTDNKLQAKMFHNQMLQYPNY